MLTWDKTDYGTEASYSADTKRLRICMRESTALTAVLDDEAREFIASMIRYGYTMGTAVRCLDGSIVEVNRVGDNTLLSIRDTSDHKITTNAFVVLDETEADMLMYLLDR